MQKGRDTSPLVSSTGADTDGACNFVSGLSPRCGRLSRTGESPLLESGYLPFLRSLQFRHDDPRRHIPDLALEIVDAMHVAVDRDRDGGAERLATVSVEQMRTDCGRVARYTSISAAWAAEQLGQRRKDKRLMSEAGMVPIEPPVTGDASMILGFLERQRATFGWKCSGLDDAGLRATVGASSMTLGGMLKHLAWVEASWFAWRLHGKDPLAPWNRVDWDADPDWDWRSAADDTPEQLRAIWHTSVTRSRVLVAEALAAGGIDAPARNAGDGDGPPTLRYILLTMIEEYARHNGHADLIRESVDGLVGQDPPS